MLRGAGGQPAAPAAQKGVCFNSPKGKCSRGTACPYEHVKGGGQPTRGRKTSDTKTRSPSKDGKKPPLQNAKKSTCRIYLRGTCKSGDKCVFAHPKPCIFFAKGTCKKGENCNFAHIQKGHLAAPANSEIPRQENEDQEQNHSVAILAQGPSRPWAVFSAAPPGSQP